MQRHISETNNLFEFLYLSNNIVAFCIPIVASVFFLISVNLMIFIVDIDTKKKQDYKIDVKDKIGYSFIPLLIFLLFYCVNLYVFSKNINNYSNIQDMKFVFGLTFQDFKLASYVSWIMIYVILFILFYVDEEISIIKSALIVVLPSFVLYIFKLLFSII